MNNGTSVWVAGAVALAVSAAAAQPYDIPWSSVDGGGGASAGGGYVLAGTIGQPDTGPPLIGGGFELKGGYWAAAGACNAADFAPPYGVLDLADINAFVAAFVSGSPGADLVPPFGVLDLADLNAFVLSFTSGCP